MAGTPDPWVGTALGPYSVEAVSGRGGMGLVHDSWLRLTLFNP